MTQTPKFVGEWCTKKSIAGDYEYASETASTYDDAFAAAVAGAKRSHVIDWITITEYRWVGGKGKRSRWELAKRWTGYFDYPLWEHPGGHLLQQDRAAGGL